MPEEKILGTPIGCQLALVTDGMIFVVGVRVELVLQEGFLCPKSNVWRRIAHAIFNSVQEGKDINAKVDIRNGKNTYF